MERMEMKPPVVKAKEKTRKADSFFSTLAILHTHNTRILLDYSHFVEIFNSRNN